MTILRLSRTTSTQDVARDLAVGTVVVTDEQTVGRGRRDRRWEAPPGTALLASFVLPAHSLASLAAGVATAVACGPEVRLKWPNDLLAQGRKLAGILVERRGDHCVVGVGVNLSWAPPDAARLGASRDELLQELISQLSRWFEATDAVVLQAWRARSATLGEMVRVELTDGVLEGVAEDIDADGALIVAGRRIVAGDVVHLRPTSPG
ncbi:MAG: biotin--[acetyl-CoA-carboxylase] ligase [Candidatus Dormibacteraeota bacterium]|uniref:biotin--[biotin carboxyl-carrier protein] ligase n=1 Tax=Candidatus Dormiibacter inghamiae TaxID=3127013 RepID=A0A934NCG9_9BACT|nr:biotin--[acetyl-CoA-carboxylase] ligase [Candidatus Dormibacteraeota bacterium]MBJ7606711.1 biotin--[acetyl-CoA-carboxylase] ligase [Candidatus Dormibacteraeota bacterium]